MKSQLSWRNGWQFVCCTALPIAARMWVKKSGELMWPASSRRFWSFQAGSMLRKTPGVWETPYQPTPKPSPFVGSAPSRDERLWSTIEFVPPYSTSCMRMGEPEYASQRHIREVDRQARIPASSDPGEVSSGPHHTHEVGLQVAVEGFEREVGAPRQAVVEDRGGDPDSYGPVGAAPPPAARDDRPCERLGPLTPEKQAPARPGAVPISHLDLDRPRL